MEQTIDLPIRALVQFLLRGGSIDSRYQGPDRGAAGTRVHRRLQKQGGPGYRAEVPLRIQMARGGFTYLLSGRADGVVGQGDETLVDEIKTTTTPLGKLTPQTHPEHWGQARCYAHILCETEGLARCAVQLTYYNLDTDETLRFQETHSAAQLSAFVEDLLDQYERWARLGADWAARRGASLRALAFPFEDYRAGQRQMAVACYNTFKAGGRLFCCAPTGIGKTMSALFPAMKALGEGYGERIFYLTAKTIARRAAEEALARLAAPGPLDFHSLTLTAKDKVCFLEERACTPEACPWANGYYDRVNDAVYALLGEGGPFDRPCIEAAAREYRLCPYELSLDLALWCDCIICDYNYLFDPVVHLQRFFEGGAGEYLFLIDEAHNLVDRGREMHSARLQKSGFFEFKKRLPKSYKRLHKALGQVNSGFVALRKSCEAENAQVLRQSAPPEALEAPLEAFVNAAEAFLEDHRGGEWEKDLLALYFEALFYLRISEGYDGHYTALVYRFGADVAVKLFCLDASAYLAESMDKGRAAVLFSATLEPPEYYRGTLGGGPDADIACLPSPFPPENLGLFVAGGISTKYAHREASLTKVADLLAAMARGKTGNYIAYFPSYRYMQQVLEAFTLRHGDIQTLVQSAGMDEAAREAFLARFVGGETTLLGFCVMGGVFSEGVDLPGERLIGCAVVGVGLPQLGPEPDALRGYYDEQCDMGFEYAYQYPGMNKVLQAAGRVIRTPEDKGVALLIDTRFTSHRYTTLFPGHWQHWQSITNETLPAHLEEFWN